MRDTIPLSAKYLMVLESYKLHRGVVEYCPDILRVAESQPAAEKQKRDISPDNTSAAEDLVAVGPRRGFRSKR